MEESDEEGEVIVTDFMVMGYKYPGAVEREKER